MYEIKKKKQWDQKIILDHIIFKNQLLLRIYSVKKYA